MLYTPENEHFGIVPVEAMYLGCVVIACNSGGPLESIDHGKTGFLLKANQPKQWAEQMAQFASNDFSEINFDHWLLEDDSSPSKRESSKTTGKDDQMTRQKLIDNAKKRVEDMFSEQVFGDTLVDCVKAMEPNRVNQ